MNSTRPRLPVILTLIIMTTVVAPLSTQDCGNCPQRVVMLYDIDVQVPQPSDPSQVLQ